MLSSSVTLKGHFEENSFLLSLVDLEKCILDWKFIFLVRILQINLVKVFTPNVVIVYVVVQFVTIE